MNHNRTKKAEHISRETFRKYHHCYPKHLSPQEAKLYNPSLNAILGTYRKTRVFCSNPDCCGNKRYGSGSKQERLTRQELIADLRYNEQLQEITARKT